MFALVFPDDTQYLLTATDAARLLNQDYAVIQRVRKTEAGTIIHVAVYAPGSRTTFRITAPFPNGTDLIYQAGGPQL